MNKNMLKALKGSIKKWEKMVNGTGVDGGKINCPLCQIYKTTTRKLIHFRGLR